ncbi:MAG: hypothetical protein GXP46_09020 [Deferribacteres bacterium]|nr:hypothetical protein [Deferribacteres bacterium]
MDTSEYINDFLYFVTRPGGDRGEGALLYCSGVNLSRFLPITKGRHRAMSNPAMRGLQLVNLGVREMALSAGATPKAVRGGDRGAEIAHTEGIWYKETLLIEDAPASFHSEIIAYCVPELLRKIDRALMLGAALPDKLLEPRELQVFISHVQQVRSGFPLRRPPD